MKRAGDARAVEAAINVTPMVDVMLVLLVIFMVTAPLLRGGLGVKLPSAKAGAAPAAHTAVHVAITAEGAIRLGDGAGPGVEVERARLGEAAAARVAACGDCPVVISADGRASYQAVAQALGELQAAGLRTLSLAVAPAAGGKAPP